MKTLTGLTSYEPAGRQCGAVFVIWLSLLGSCCHLVVIVGQLLSSGCHCVAVVVMWLSSGCQKWGRSCDMSALSLLGNVGTGMILVYVLRRFNHTATETPRPNLVCTSLRVVRVRVTCGRPRDS